ncbi:SDR family NAD(P)-dependent oxidoreductase [Fervidobacterium gondwanense]|uniref:SDR family NAD(P)-dependent oxidoreductase n=1 Tax=Fervidobacterium gondwanense TaxID=44754 RepID=UPI003C76686F
MKYLKHRLKTSRNSWLFLIDTLLLLLSGVTALFVRFGQDFAEMRKYAPGVFVLIGITAVANLLNGTYKIVWRYAQPIEFLKLLRGLFIGYATTVLFLHFTRIAILLRSVGMLTFLGSYFLLFSARTMYQYLLSIRKSAGKRIGIVGAGDAGVILLNEIRRTNYGYVVAFFDDDPAKINKTIANVQVIGRIDELDKYINELELDEVLIAIPSASKEVLARISEKVDTTKVKVKTFPSISEFLTKEPTIEDLRELSIQDIIGREPVKVDLLSISDYISGKIVLITGAGGSIGSEIARQIINFAPKRLFILGRGENSIYEIYNELRERNQNVEITPIIADVTDSKLLEHIISTNHPEIIFHAAAHKHVFFMQNNLYEALRVNVLGTINLAKLSCKYNVERLVFISTDKAVNPTSYMGLSKRIAELYLLSIPDTCPTRFSIVRFGNVIGSRGSVLWKFKKQIEKGGPITITDPKMKRYWMSIPEAVSLVIQAGAYANKKELYVLDMGEQIPVENVAKTLAKLMGKPDIQIIYTGAVPGEKLEEELFYDYETPEPTHHPKISRVRYNNLKAKDTEIEETIYRVMELLTQGEEHSALEIVKSLLP